MMVRFLAEGEAWSSAPDAGELWGQGRCLIVRSPSGIILCLIVMPRYSLSYAKIGK